MLPGVPKPRPPSSLSYFELINFLFDFQFYYFSFLACCWKMFCRPAHSVQGPAKWGGKGGEASLLRFRHSTFSTTDKKTCASSSVRAPGLVLSRGGVWPRPPVPLPLLSPLVLWLQLLRPPKPPLPNRRLSEELLSIWSRFILPFVFCNFELEPAILRLKRPSATTIVSNLFDKNRLSKFFSSLYNIDNTPHLPYV